VSIPLFPLTRNNAREQIGKEISGFPPREDPPHGITRRSIVPREQDADSTIPLNTCLYIYFIFRFRRMLKRDAPECLNETLFNCQQRNGYKIWTFSSTTVSFELSSDSLSSKGSKGGAIIPSLLISRCVLVIIVQGVTTRTTDRLSYGRTRFFPESYLSCKRTCWRARVWQRKHI